METEGSFSSLMLRCSDSAEWRAAIDIKAEACAKISWTGFSARLKRYIDSVHCRACFREYGFTVGCTKETMLDARWDKECALVSRDRVP
jgi:hypothetical protein